LFGRYKMFLTKKLLGECYMLKMVFFTLILCVSSYANSEYSLLYKVEKGSKKLGHYEVNLAKTQLSSKSYGASQRLEMFSTKKIDFVQEGFKKVHFVKNKKVHTFNVVTELSALDKQTKEKYDRKFKKVKGNNMLFITKEGKNTIDLFNKRATVVKTLEELLSDLYYNNLKYDTFILFDKLGVMKMVAKVVKKTNEVVIQNHSKKKPYMKITLENGVPVSIESLVSNWRLTAVAKGVFKEYSVDLDKMLAKSYTSKISGSRVEFSKVKKAGKFYNLDGKISFDLAKELFSEKGYKQNAYCKKQLKQAHIKHKKIKIQNNQCVATLKVKAKISDLKKEILSELTQKHPQLKITKKIKFKNNNIVYKVL